MKLRWIGFLACLSLVVALLGPVAPAESAPPNIIVIMADDLGWRDLHCYGNEAIDTPCLDQFASEGMQFTDAYAASPVCSPTRAAMMTGMTPARLRITNHAPGHPDGYSLENSDLKEAESVRHLTLDYTTIAERLKDAGYDTAHLGKWHLSYVARNNPTGIKESDLRPQHQGFDINIGGTGRGGPPTYFSPYRNDALADGPEGEYLPERLADEAIQYVQAHKDKPFFLSWWPFSVHYPLEAPNELIEKYRQRKAINDPVYAAMIEGMDTAIGRFLKALDDSGLRDNTLVIFKSDNGGYNGNNRPLRGFKGMMFEGGIRIPWMVRWPGVIEPGTTCDEPIVSTDCFPTLLEVAGLEQQPGAICDGMSLMPLWKQTAGFERDAIYFHYPNYAFHKRNRLASAIRSGDFKLIRRYDENSLELYDLKNDIGERKNLASSRPKLAKQLNDRLGEWLVDVEAALPQR